MKRNIIFLILIACFISSKLSAQDGKYTRIPLIGEQAPGFTAKSTIGDIKFPEDYFAKWKILFSHPADFTPVCSSEILELAKLQNEFKKLNTTLLVISTDGLNSHLEWVNSLENIEYKNNPKVKIDFAIIADDNMEISKKYGMIHPSYNDKRDIRGVFIIDPDNKVQAIFFYPASTGRNFEEILRTLIAIQASEKESVLTPANWKPGEDFMIPAPTTKQEAEKMSEKKDPRYYYYAWYMWFKKQN